MTRVRGKGLFVDLDGTLADSLTVLREVYFSFLAEFGAEGSEAEFQRSNGPPLARIIAALKKSHGLPGDPAEMMEVYSAMVRQAHEVAPPAKGARELLGRAQRKGWKVAVVTSSAHLSALTWLARNGLEKHVDAVVGGDEVDRGKPAPAPYILALSRVRCGADGSLAVEDSRIGARSAVAAGLSTWILATPDDRSDWPAEVGFITGLADVMEML